VPPVGWLQNGSAVLPAPAQEWLNRGLSCPKSACPPVVSCCPHDRRSPHARPDRRRPHKHSHTTAVLDQHGTLLDQQRFPATRDGHRALRRWAARWPQRHWAVEGAGGVGRILAQQLIAQGEQVTDVPAKLAARVRALSPGHGRKADTGDAISIAHAALHASGLHQVSAEDHPTVLRLLSDRRDDLVRARTQTLNRLHQLLAELHPQALAATSPLQPPPPCCDGSGPAPTRPAPAGR
jgi:hypothetical protein